MARQRLSANPGSLGSEILAIAQIPTPSPLSMKSSFSVGESITILGQEDS